MSKLKIEKPSSVEKKKLGIPANPTDVGVWSVWECKPSSFDWLYPATEVAYIYEGKVRIKTISEEFMIGAGDLVTFPKGLTCHWEVLEKVRKVYQFDQS